MDDATRSQHLAAEPFASTWLSANAGSGKTRVLTDRVARLLLRGVLPENILCLTYTKAAASEMQNRLFKRLGAWAMLSTDDLRKALSDVGEAHVENPDQARTLFARAIETPGGLKIQTIHSFCTSILRRFPLEAGVTPRFRELDEIGSAELIREVLDDMARRQDRGLADIALHFTGEDLTTLAQTIASHRDRFSDRIPDIKALYGLPAEFDDASLLAEAFALGDEILIQSVVPVLRGSDKVSDQKLGDKLAVLPMPLGLGALPLLESAMLFGEKTKDPFGPKIGSQPTKGLRSGAFQPFEAGFNDLMQRVADARPKRLGLAASRATEALHLFARAFLDDYAKRKEAVGVLDFDDLILKTRALLTDPAVAAWVLYRLDGGIDHILVDEAQDTSPSQWSVIRALADEMSSGEGAGGDTPRTLFVVGDKKQSIYSFQGADPTSFDTVADDVEARLQSGDGLKRRTLDFSFRSAPSILRAVDSVFQGPMQDGLGKDVIHRAFHTDKPGRVDLWPLTEADEEGDTPAWYDPVDTPSITDPNVRLADQIADEISRMVRDETLPDENGGRRAVRPGDVLILVQGRNVLFHQIIRALKDADLPVAGADRLKIASSLAVRDILALLAFLALPEDDLSLAAALRSPLFGWSEDDLYRLAKGRSGYLWQDLRTSEAHPKTRDTLRELRRKADFTRPFELISEILTRWDGRKNILARLGGEAEDGLNELLNQALVYETQNVPTLAGFVAWMQAGDVDVKRQSDATGTLIRVMTVHGAKGLEAPIVFLPDTMRAETSRGAPSVRISEDGVPIWATPAEERDHLAGAAHGIAKEKDAEERRRLLYVAMTRAENWLVVCGAAKKNEIKGSWYESVEAGLKTAGAKDQPFADGQGLRLESGDWTTPPTVDDPAPQMPSVERPNFTDAASFHPSLALRSPSDLGGAKTIPGAEADPDSTTRGTAIHTLLEILPELDPETWADIAEAVATENGLDAADLLGEASRTIKHSGFAPFFTADALVEAELSAPSSVPGIQYAGTVDRLIVGAESVTIIDYKTNRDVPDRAEDVPEGLLRQMGAYLEMAESIFPDQAIRLILLWTANTTMTELPHSIVREALARATSS